MAAIERQRYHNKGIFTVTQLSYTFHPRRKHKHVSKLPTRPVQALRARAIREHKIHLDGAPKLSLLPNLVFLDVEGIPDYRMYYLIGLRIKHNDSYTQCNFWADASADEKTMWNNCLTTLMAINHPQLIYYGTYETTFLKRMKERYCNAPEHKQFVDQLLAESINILSSISGRIYFPTFSNGLKDIARYLGFKWSHPDSSGLSALAWRSEWECSRQITVKQQLITYNMEDCEAVEYVTKAVSQLAQQYSTPESSNDSDAVLIDLLQPNDTHRFQVNNFAFPELNTINQSAYWDYQRDKIYIRSNPRLKYIAKKKPKGRIKLFAANKVIDYPMPDHCPKCQSSQIACRSQRQKVMYDLKFGHGSVKRWVVKYIFHKYKCSLCNEIFDNKQELALEGRYGQNILAYIMYQMIELNISQIAIADDLNQMFGFHLERHVIHRQKALVANRYTDTYEYILKCITEGNLVHVDETKVTINGEDEYVWVITNLENVIYFHTKTRAGDKLHGILNEFQGVLVSDFYAAYDSFKCPQQKCLIHLIRDMNEDIRKNPFDDDLKTLIHEFAQLLKSIIETVDQFGLKTRFLCKHKIAVDHFYEQLLKKGFASEGAIKYQKRLTKNREKLFTFLDYDGIPWNNNNAEHAVKAFAMLRRVIRATSSEMGISDYLILLSISETCKCKGVNFLNFLRSGEKDIDKYIQRCK